MLTLTSVHASKSAFLEHWANICWTLPIHNFAGLSEGIPKTTPHEIKVGKRSRTGHRLRVGTEPVVGLSWSFAEQF